MDFGNALYLTAAVFGLVTLIKVVLRITDQRWVVLITVANALVAVFLLGATVWADEQVIGGETLDQLDFWSKVTAGLFLAGAETGLFLGLESVKNIGNNQPKPIDPRWLPEPGTTVVEALNKQAEDG
jgi:hypothetical protein